MERTEAPESGDIQAPPRQLCRFLHLLSFFRRVLLRPWKTKQPCRARHQAGGTWWQSSGSRSRSAGSRSAMAVVALVVVVVVIVILGVVVVG